VEPGAVRLAFANAGTAGAVLHVYDRLHPDAVPRRYAVEAGAAVDDVWTVDGTGGYDLWVLGPNGFVRHFEGSTTDTAPEIDVRVAGRGGLAITFHNRGTADLAFIVTANAYRARAPKHVRVRAGRSATRAVRLAASKRWYDLTITIDGNATFRRRVAGRVENGRPSVTDPAWG
jgi:phospholipase C